LGNLSKLNTLTLAYNQLSGPIPASIGTLPLANLFINNNYFTFAGMEMVAQMPVSQLIYAPQGIVPLNSSCGELSVSVGGTLANNTYQWFNNGVLVATITDDSTYHPTGPGSYYVVVTNSIAQSLTLYSDTLSGNVPVHHFSAEICGGTTYTLPSGKQVDSTGIYNDTLLAVSGCGDSLITVLNLTVSALTRDTIHARICPGGTYTLPSGNQVSIQGTYADTVHNALGCDSIITDLFLTVIQAQQISKTLTLCLGQNYTLPSGQKVTTAGTYSDTLRSTLGCDSLITSLTLVVDASTQQIQDTMTMCPGSYPLVLTAGGSANTYAWNNGSSSSSLSVSSAGLYTVVVNGAGGCTANDTFHVMTDRPPVPQDTSIVLCSGVPKLINAGGNNQSYLWSTGAMTPFIMVSTMGTYWVIVTDSAGCSATDTIHVTGIENPPSGFLPPDTAVCTYGSVLIKPESNFSSYLWNTGATGDSLSVSQPGMYWLSVIDTNGCAGADSISVTSKACVEGFFVPSSFTPNGDGHNDLLKPITFNNLSLSQYQFRVYNRWGQLVFESGNPSAGWDGKVNGSVQPASVYVWMLQYQYLNGPSFTLKGTVTLMQ
jgi:gliding motility-associated-like protein